MKTLYEILGLDRDASYQDVVNKYQKYIRMGPSEDYRKRIEEAYRILSDPKLRAAYDEKSKTELEYGVTLQITSENGAAINMLLSLCVLLIPIFVYRSLEPSQFEFLFKNEFHDFYADNFTQRNFGIALFLPFIIITIIMLKNSIYSIRGMLQLSYEQAKSVFSFILGALFLIGGFQAIGYFLPATQVSDATWTPLRIGTTAIIATVFIISLFKAYGSNDRRRKLEMEQDEKWKKYYYDEKRIKEEIARFESEIPKKQQLPDSFRGKDIYVFRNIIKPSYFSLLDKFAYNDAAQVRIKEDLLNYIESMKDNATSGFLWAEGGEKYGFRYRESEEESRALMDAIENRYATAVGADAIQLLSEIRKAPYGSFNRDGIKAPEGYTYFLNDLRKIDDDQKQRF